MKYIEKNGQKKVTEYIGKNGRKKVTEYIGKNGRKKVTGYIEKNGRKKVTEYIRIEHVRETKGKGWRIMSGIVYDARRVKAYEGLMALGQYAGKEEEWLNRLWEKLIPDNGLMKEFMYYLDYHTFCDEDRCRGYALTDLYVWQMDRYNLIRDIGKNTESCNKEAMVLNAFYTMTEMKKDPDTYVRRLTAGQGMDQLY